MSDIRRLLTNKLGLGTAPLGNMFRDIPEDEALETVEAAWQAGVRYFDTAPLLRGGTGRVTAGRSAEGTSAR